MEYLAGFLKTFSHGSAFCVVNSCVETVLEDFPAVIVWWSLLLGFKAEYELFYCYSVLNSQLIFILPDWEGEFCYVHVTLLFDSSLPSCQVCRKEGENLSTLVSVALLLPCNCPLKRASTLLTPGS